MHSIGNAWIIAMAIGISAPAVAQQKQRVSFTVPAAKYTQQHFIDVGDATEHKLRLYELYRAFPSDPPVFDGSRLVELWIRGISDFAEVNGLATAYSVYVFESGDKV